MIIGNDVESAACEAGLQKRMHQLAENDICLAFSGGADSSLLLKMAVDAAAETNRLVYAVTFDTRLHPSCDLEIAERVAAELGGIHHVIRVDELAQEPIRKNPKDRCYLCKRHLFHTLKEYASELGVKTVLDGTNEDDQKVYRPGIRALKELGVISPLAEFHITKKQVKQMAARYGVSVAARPSTPCLATRLPYGTAIEYEVLEKISAGEEYLRGMIKGNVRLRLHQDIVRIEVDKAGFAGIIERSEEIGEQLKKLGFSYITLDLLGFRSGSMDEGLSQEERADFASSSV